MTTSCSKQTLQALALSLLKLTQNQLSSCLRELQQRPYEPLTQASELDSALRQRIQELLECGRVEQEWQRCMRIGIRVVPWLTDDYPPALYDLLGPPSLLFLRGKGPWPPGPSLTIVGSRKSTALARNFAEDIGTACIESEVCVISGLAYGIDQAADLGAQRAGGPSYAIMAGGVDRVDPAGARDMAQKVVANGLMISEMPLGTLPHKPLYPRRNRIMAALSPATLVVEAAERSGSLITAHHALELGREVFAMPGSLGNPQASGTNELIRDGAHVVLERADLSAILPKVHETRPRNPWTQALATPQTAAGLAQKLNLPLDEVAMRLVELEIEGSLQNLGGGLYQRKA